MSKYEYLIDKVKGADFSFKPFKHIIIKNFLSEEHFKEIVNTPQIRKHNLPNTKALIQELLQDGYDIQTFPGCITSVEKYLEFIEQYDLCTRLLFKIFAMRIPDLRSIILDNY